MHVYRRGLQMCLDDWTLARNRSGNSVWPRRGICVPNAMPMQGQSEESSPNSVHDLLPVKSILDQAGVLMYASICVVQMLTRSSYEVYRYKLICTFRNVGLELYIAKRNVAQGGRTARRWCAAERCQQHSSKILGKQ